jgi:hypothetical protein
MRPSCPRLFEVEAMRDGRLSGAERTNFERHMTTCSVCSQEERALDALADAFRDGQAEEMDELHTRRERTRLLAAFDGALVPEEPKWRGLRPLLVLAAAAALMVAVFLRWRPAPVAEGHAPVPASNTVVRADSAALYSKRTEGNRDKIVLERGALWIRVTHADGERSLLVELPDGELEDTGTTFSVNTEGGHTTRVTVEEGSVVLRLRGQPSIALEAGETWNAPSPPVAVAPAPSPPEHPSPPARSASPPRAPAPPLPDPSDDFRAAMAAFDSGDHREAAARFESFLEKHPRDPRAEDAAYLRVFALQKSGDSTGMKEAAQEYLRRYPAGFRHTEVENLSR